MKHYGWGIVDKDGVPAKSLGTYPSKEHYDSLARTWTKQSVSRGPYRTVELFYKEDTE